MVKKINDFLAGMPMTIVAGLCLLLSFVLPRAGYPKAELFAWAAVIICGLPLLYLAIWRVIHNKGISKISSALLICIGMIAALLTGDLFAAGEVGFIMSLGALLEDMTTERARKGIKNLLSLAPQQGRRIVNGKEEMIPADQICRGDIIRILPGEIIPVDGVITNGETSVDQSIMTGESLPVDKGEGEGVFCGTLNCFGTVEIRATNVGEDSSLQKMIRMVQEAEKNQAPTQRIADKWASYLVPAALTIAVVTGLVTKDIVRAVTILVVFCPCALVLATPTAIIAAIGQASKYGVIIKSGEALENMGHVKTIAFDKTGTLTRGKLAVTDVITFGNINRKEFLSAAGSVERKSEHPLGKAITEYAREENIPFKECTGFKMQAGKGVSAKINGGTAAKEGGLAGARMTSAEAGSGAVDVWQFGNEKYMSEAGILLQNDVPEVLSSFRKQGKACVIAAKDQKIVGVIALADSLREDAQEVIRRLSQMQVKTVLLTGDHVEAAEHLASRIGISEVRSDLLPEDKVTCIRQLKNNDKVCMIGDGVNDAPALKTADVGIAMGVMGSDIAVEAADAALMTDDISRIPYLKWLSDTTVKTIRTAITLSMCINFTAVSLSAAGVLNPTTGALVHNAGSCFVVLLAALLYDRKYK